MKQILIILAFILISLSGFSQDFFEGITGLKYLGTDTAKVNHNLYINGELVKFQSPADGQILKRKLLGGVHTWTNANLDAVDSIFIVKDTINNITYINYVLGGTTYNITNNAIPEGKISGGKVTRIDSLKFDVTPTTYYISGNLYTTNRDTVTLDDPDPTNPRIDIIGVDTTGVAIIIKGTPNANPQKPSIDPLSQVELTQVLVMKDSVAVDVTPESYDYWGIGVNNGAARLIKSREALKLFGFDEGVEVSRIGNSIYFKADTTFLASLYALNDTAQAIRDDFPVITPDTLFATVATTGSYTDLINKPTLGTTTNSHILKFDTGTNEGIDLYTFNGSAAKTVDVKAGENITLTKTSGSITISATVNNDIETPQILTGTTPTWNISNGKNAKISLTGNTTITLTNFNEGQSGSLTVINAATQYTLNIVQAGYVNAISKSIGTPGNYTKLNTTGAAAVDKYSWYYDGYYMFWRGETDYIKP